MKTIFVMNIENTIDLITNSSSELFVLKGGTKEAIVQMLDGLYPEWRKEYEEPKNITEATLDELNTFFSYACSPHCSPASIFDYPELPGFSWDELYEKSNVSWGGEYALKNNKKSMQDEWDRDFVTEKNMEEIIKKLSPNNYMWFLFSFDDNPNWEMQERLMTVADRYHLG